jgi:hypothetical protein
MSFLYPRIIAIHRPNPATGFGAQGYSGQTKADETVIASGIPASIQQKSSRFSKGEVALPANSSTSLGWHIFIPKGAMAFGTISSRDVVVDDLGHRYSIFAPYWNSLGHNLLCELEEA